MSTSDWTIADARAGDCDGGPGLSAAAGGVAEAPAAGAPAGGGGGDRCDDVGGAGGRERANAAVSVVAASSAASAAAVTAATADNVGTAAKFGATEAFRSRTVTALPDVMPSCTTESASDPETFLGGKPALNCILKWFPGA